MEAETETDVGVRRIGPTIDYADGAEAEVLQILQRAADRSSRSDELALQAHDWATTYHLARARSNLLAPLRLAPGVRVLDVGAGTGVLARAIGETGASVLALEGTLPRAQAAAVRTEELTNVEVVGGHLDHLDAGERFDVVLCCGVLEYSVHFGEGPAKFLEKMRAHLNPGGALVVAIENQLGLKYVLGFSEDHLAEPWVGVEGYAGAPRAETFSRAVLRQMLVDVDLPAQAWHYPFPDYKLPRVLLSEAVFAAPDRVDLVDQLLRWPCRGGAGAPTRVCNDRSALRVLVEAGVGEDFGNSFLVVASENEQALDQRVERGPLAWYFGTDRLQWCNNPKRVESDGTFVPMREAGTARRGWLTHRTTGSRARVHGRTLEQLAFEACWAGRGPEEVIRRWDQHLGGLERTISAAEPSHPYIRTETSRVLPADRLDVLLSNFVVDRSDEIHYIDDEWVAPEDVDAELVRLRALWSLAADIVTYFIPNPAGVGATQAETTLALARFCEPPIEVPLARFLDAEAEFQAAVTGLDTSTIRAELEKSTEVTQLDPSLERVVPFTTLRKTLWQLLEDNRLHESRWAALAARRSVRLYRAVMRRISPSRAGW
jgi:O-antigen biosynthesis protein